MRSVDYGAKRFYLIYSTLLNTGESFKFQCAIVNLSVKLKILVSVVDGYIDPLPYT